MALIRPIPTTAGAANPQFVEDTTCTAISSGDTISFNSTNPYRELIIFNGYTGSFTVTFETAALNPGCCGVKTDNGVVQLANETTYDASDFTLLFKTASASGYTANITFS